MAVNKFILVLAYALTSSCQYSPWETDIDCQDSYTSNLEELRKIESNMTGDAFGVALIADIHIDLTDAVNVIDRIKQRDDVAFVIVLGDMTRYGLATEYEWVCKAMSSLDVPRFYVIGNHDSISFGKEIFRENFAPYDYEFTFKDVKFILYNDNAYEFKDVPDYDFLSNAALIQGGETRRLTLAVSHAPPVKGAHTEEEVAIIRQFLFEQGIDLTLHGDKHVFDHWIDEFGVPHHITGRVRNSKYGMLFIDEFDQISIQSCAPTCTETLTVN